jgi:hypothetical protein
VHAGLFRAEVLEGPEGQESKLMRAVKAAPPTAAKKAELIEAFPALAHLASSLSWPSVPEPFQALAVSVV